MMIFWPLITVSNKDSLQTNFRTSASDPKESNEAKQKQFTKPTSEPRASDPEESNEAFNRAIRGWLL